MSALLTVLLFFWTVGGTVLGFGVYAICFTADGREKLALTGRELREDRSIFLWLLLPVWPVLFVPGPIKTALFDFIAPVTACDCCGEPLDPGADDG